MFCSRSFPICVAAYVAHAGDSGISGSACAGSSEVPAYAAHGGDATVSGTAGAGPSQGPFQTGVPIGRGMCRINVCGCLHGGADLLWI